jgi:ABC-2 type transport system ATP-binding protein
MNPAVQITQLKKYYGRVPALQGVDLEIRTGEFFGLLGPNGAGKTTLINGIVGLVKPTEGEIKVFGSSVRKDPLTTKRQIGFSPQEVNVERFFNLQRTLEFQGGFYGLKPAQARARAREMLKQFGLTEKSRQQFYKLSGGMQKRLLIARALVSNPRLLILDEPTAGVDVEQRHELWKYLRNLNRDGTTIILTTHYIDEAEALCERVGIIDHGRIMELGSPRELIAKYCRARVSLDIAGEISAEEFRDLPEARVEGKRITASAPAVGPILEKILTKVLSKSGRRILDVHVDRGSLEEVFVKVTGKSLAEEEKHAS